MRVSVRALIAVAAVSVALPAVAGENVKEQIRLRRIAWSYGKCVVQKHHATAAEAVLATAGNKEIMGRLSQIVDSDCLEAAAGVGVDMRFPNDNYKYALADALVNADFAVQGETSFANRLPLAQPAIINAEQQSALLARAKAGRERDNVREEINKQNVMAWLSRFGECVVRNDPVSARYLLMTPPDTPEEMSRIRALQPTFSICLSEGTVHFNRVTIRGTVAVNYYRLAMATVVPAAGSAH